MLIRDYNGEGIWSVNEILRRYSLYCRELKILNPLDLSPIERVEGDATWIYPVMEKVIAGIERGDAACRRIGIEFIEENQKFVFGRILKSNTARALRRSDLDDAEKDRIRRRAVTMLIEGNVPHEYKQYAKLLRKIGVGNYWNEIEKTINRSNGYVMKYYDYLKSGF